MTIEIEETKAGKERTQALKVKRKDGTEQTIIMKGAFSELFYRVLNILFEKSSNYSDNYSLESGDTVIALHAVDARAITTDVIADFIEFVLVMNATDRKCILAIGYESQANPGTTQMLRDLAIRYNVPVAEPTSLAQALGSIKQPVN